MRPRDEILNGDPRKGHAPAQGRTLDLLEVLLDIRDELVRQGKPVEVIAEAGPDYKGMVFQLQNAAIDMAAKIKELEGGIQSRDAEIAGFRRMDHGLARVGNLVGIDTARAFAVEEVVSRVGENLADAASFGVLRPGLADYLGLEPTASVVGLIAAVRDLGSLAQDRKDEIARLGACATVCDELVKLLKVPDHTHLAQAVEDALKLAEGNDNG